MKMKYLLITLTILLVSFTSIVAQEITVFPGFGTSGFYQDKYPITKAQFESLVAQNKVANAFWLKSKKQRTISLIAVGAELGFLAWGTIATARSNKLEILPLVGALGSTVVSIGFSISSAKMLRMSVLEYNEGLEHNTSLYIGTTRNGIGLVVSL